jgi:hypothetical protein
MSPAPSGLQEEMDSTIYSEIRILIDILLAIYLAITSSLTLPELQQKYPRAPQMPSPELFLQMLILRHQVVCRLPFQPLQQAADCHLRRDRYEEMYIVLGHMPFHDLDLVPPANTPDQISHPLSYVSTQCRSSITRYPHQIQMDLENRMRAVSVIRHPPSLVPGARAEAVA